MANHASADKRNRQRVVRTARNRRVRSTVRTVLKKAREALEKGDAKAATQPVLTTAAETTKPEETRNGALTRISASGAEAAVNNESSPTSAMPAGDRQDGEVAPDTIVITIVP